MIEADGLQRVERIDRQLSHKGAIVDFYTDTVVTPLGKEEKFDFINHKGAAAILPVFPDGRIVLVKQYRNAVDSYTLEIPAGGKNYPDEPTKECAFRELEEETGYRSEIEDIGFLMTIYTTMAYCNERIDIYVADKLKPSEQRLDDDEYIDVVSYSIEEILEMIKCGDIVDAKTIAAVMTYKAMVESE